MREARLWRGIADFDNLRVAVGYTLASGDTDLAVRLVGRSWVLAPLCRAELLEWARTVVGLPGSQDHSEVNYVYLIIAEMSVYIGAFEESNRAADAARSRPLTDEAWAVAFAAKWDSGGLSGRRDDDSLLADFAERLDQPANRFGAAIGSLAREAYTGKPATVDTARLIQGADRSGIASRRVQSRAVAALTLHARGRAAEAVANAREALKIAERGPNRHVINTAKEILALVSGATADVEAGDDLAESTRRGHASSAGSIPSASATPSSVSSLWRNDTAGSRKRPCSRGTSQAISASSGYLSAAPNGSPGVRSTGS